MAKRFVDTALGRDVWFRKLSPKIKCVFRFLCDECDAAGVWAVDMETMVYFIGEEVTIDEFFPAINDKKIRIEFLTDSKIFIKDFINFQYGSLSEQSPAHKPVFNLIQKHNLTDRVFNRVSNTLQEKEKETDKEKEKETEKEDRGVGEGLNELPPSEKPPMLKNNYIVPLMMVLVKEKHPSYIVTDSDPYSCQNIAVKINNREGWHHEAYLNGKKDECLLRFGEILTFVATDDFYSTKQLSTIDKNFGSILMEMKKPKNGKSKSASKTNGQSELADIARSRFTNHFGGKENTGT